MLITSSEVLKTKLTAVQRPVVSSEFIEFLGEHGHLGYKFEHC